MKPTAQQVKEVSRYESGALIRNSTGKRGYIRPDGYVYVRLNGKSYGEHRLVNLLFTGEWPEQVDHINGKRSDNRPENLRSANHAQNCMNRKKGDAVRKGCYWVARIGKWMVQIGIGGKRKTIGYFSDIEEAHAAYCRAAEQSHKEFARFG